MPIIKHRGYVIKRLVFGNVFTLEIKEMFHGKESRYSIVFSIVSISNVLM